MTTMTRKNKQSTYYRRHIIVLSLTMGAFIFITGCKKFVAIPPPSTEVVTASTFNNSATATAALLNIYNGMGNANDESYNLAHNNGLLADELTNFDKTGISDIEFYTNSMDS